MKLSDLHWLNKPNLNIKLKNLPHGIIISGPIGLGKEILAKDIASKLLINKNTSMEDTDLFSSNNHPDFFLLDKEKILLHNITYRKNNNRCHALLWGKLHVSGNKHKIIEIGL